MELRQLEYFLETARLNNMTEAAKALHVSQPSLSNAVKSLEKELGVSLFDRNGKRIALNDAGRYFARRVEAATDVLNEAAAVVSQHDEQRAHTVNCTMGIPMGNSGKLIRAFSDAHPDIRVRMGYPDSTLFREQTIDMHLFGTSVNLDDTNVIKLGYERYMLLVPPDHPFAHRESIALKEAAREPFIFTEPSEIYEETHNMCRAVGFEPVTAYESQVCFEAVNMVEAGLGCAVAAEFTWLQGIRTDAVALPITDQPRGRYLYARFPDGLEPSESAWKFINYMQDYADELVGKRRTGK